MIHALLIIWSLDPSGAGTVNVRETPSLGDCYITAGRVSAVAPKVRVTCQPASEVADVVTQLAEIRCDGQDGFYICKGRKP